MAADEKVREQGILEDIKLIVAREVKNLKRKKEDLTGSEIAALEKFAKIAAIVMGANKDLAQNLQGLSDEDLEALAE